MAAVPTLEEEDAKRPSREREGLVGERTRIVNRMKGALARLGVRGFKPTLRGAPERLAALRTAEGARRCRRRRPEMVRVDQRNVGTDGLAAVPVQTERRLGRELRADHLDARCELIAAARGSKAYDLESGGFGQQRKRLRRRAPFATVDQHIVRAALGVRNQQSLLQVAG